MLSRPHVPQVRRRKRPEADVPDASRGVPLGPDVHSPRVTTAQTSVESAVGPEQPRFRVQAGRLGLVVDADLGAEAAYELLDGAAFGGADVGGGDDDAQRHAAFARLGERVLEDAQDVPAYEGSEQVGAVGAGELGANLGAVDQ